MANQYFVEKGYYEKDGKKFSTYSVKVKFMGNELSATVIPQDKGGYQLLDIIFNGIEKSELIVKPFEIKDSVTGNVIKGKQYAVQVTDEEGQTLECKVVPARKSDKYVMELVK